ncbi:mucin-5AC-like [Crotalus tigris]|uniref:mucin-5AC-like n=1 Tax=Crotalus tigris TaxID=88082 RepID=UPI00192F3E49|nr:mucin-5AC-like [Crotalus tigris]
MNEWNESGIFEKEDAICGLQYPDPKSGKANAISEYSGATEAPWLVNIYGNGQRCQGVILSSLWVLTAANCFLLMNPSQVELTGSPGHSSTKTVSQFLLHRGFSSWNTAPNNDLGLILLAQPVDLTAEDMWPACIPREEKPYNTQEECRIFERGQEGSMRWFLKETMVEALSISDCSKHWPNTTEGRNLCVAKKDPPKLTTCKVPVGSPVICHDPVTWEWEVMGLVSQSLHNCTVPILASQLLSHLQWLKQVGALENPLQPEDKLPSAAGQQQPVTLLGPTTVQIPLETLKVPVILPAAKQIFKLPSSEAAITVSLPPVQATTTATTKLSTTNQLLEATVAATTASPPTKPPTLETITIIEATKLPPVEKTTVTVIELPSTNLPLLETIMEATAASPLTKPPALETIAIIEATKLPPVEKTTATIIESPSTNLPLLETIMEATAASPLTKSPTLETIAIIEATKLPPVEKATATVIELPSTNLPLLETIMEATAASPLTKPPALEIIMVTEATKPPSMETTTITTTKLPSTSLPLQETITAATTATPSPNLPVLGTITITEAPPLERTMTTTLSLSQTTKQLGAVSSTTKNSILYSSNPAQETNNVILTTAHESSPTTSASSSPTTKPQHGAPTSSGRLPQETLSIPGQPTTAGMASTKSLTPRQQSPVTSMTSHQLSPVVSSMNKRSFVTMRTTTSFSQTSKQPNVKLDQSPFSITRKPSVRATQTLVASTARQPLQTSLIYTHHHIVITPHTYSKQSKPLSSPATR